MDLYRAYESKQFTTNTKQFSHVFDMNRKQDVLVPKISEKSRNLYADNIKIGTHGPIEPTHNNMRLYDIYLKNIA
jgi:hypothetical protein